MEGKGLSESDCSARSKYIERNVFLAHSVHTTEPWMCNLAVNEVKNYWCCALLCSEIKLQKMERNVLHVFSQFKTIKNA